MKCKVIKKAYCPIQKRYLIPGETIEVTKAQLKGYLPYVQCLEVEESTKDNKKKRGDG